MDNNKYAQQEKEMWEAKDLRIAKLSCLNRATDIAISLWTHPAVKSLDINPDKLKTESAKQICELADVFVRWVYGERHTPESAIEAQTKHDMNKKSDMPIPQPTLEQKQIFEQLAKDTGLTYDFVLQHTWKRKGTLVIENIESAIKYFKNLVDKPK